MNLCEAIYALSIIKCSTVAVSQVRMSPTSLLGAPEIITIYILFTAHRRLAQGKAEGSGQAPNFRRTEGPVGWLEEEHLTPKEGPKRAKKLSWGCGHRVKQNLDKVKKI